MLNFLKNLFQGNKSETLVVEDVNEMTSHIDAETHQHMVESDAEAEVAVHDAAVGTVAEATAEAALQNHQEEVPRTY